MLKRLTCLAMATLMVVGLTACKEKADNDSDYSYYDEIIVNSTDNQSTTSQNGQETESQTTSNAPNNNNSTTTSSKKPGTPNAGLDEYAGNTDKMIEALDFKGESITIMREWEPYPNGVNAAWDNFNAWLAKCEKRFNVKIVEKKWKATLAGEMLSGVKPEGHYYLVGVTGGGNVYDMAVKGYLAYMDDAMKKTGITMKEDIYSEFNTGINNVNGKQWTIGFGFSRISATVLYNKKLLAEAGYQRTLTTDTSVQGLIDSKKWTWKKMTEIAKKTTKRNNSGEVTQWGIGISGQGINGMILANDGHILHPNSKGKFTSYLNTENVKEAIEQVYNWYHVDKVASAFEGGQWTDMGKAFGNKKVAMIFGGHADEGMAYSTLTADEFGVAYIPMGPRMKKYIAYMTWEYSYVVPATYQDRTTELLLLAHVLHDWPVEGYTRDDEFRDEWTRYFHSKEQYNIWYNHHFGKDIVRKWDGSQIVGCGVSYADILSGTKTPAVWVDANHNACKKAAQDASKKYTYTGFLK